MSSICSNEAQARRESWQTNCPDLQIAGASSVADRYRLSESIEFFEDFEFDFARRLDRYGIAWHYKPRTFAVEWDEDGNFIDSFTPGFFLPASALYLELVTAVNRSFVEKERKARLLREQYPGTRIEVVVVEDIPHIFRPTLLYEPSRAYLHR
jgi:hypothetical protein